ncbi:GAP family protein [Streptomyces sp. A7024]|uniref:GAP family protein n=1 Tax=Streptomyces coryli TaxID=1128680 RepID=A0A6G4TSX8_9ACTN|nr:GAP family protein [Streptomyces coryli]NGN62640.1 GAP family protein [Streptomyces coryli]
MGNAMGSMLPMALGVALSPMPVIAIILMLGTPRARSNGPSFTLGWISGLTLVGALVLLLTGGPASSDQGEQATWVTVLALLIGVFLLLLAARAWRGRPAEGQQARMPKWMSAIDQFSPVKSFGMGALLSGVNPKNLALNLGAMTAIAETGIPGGQQAVTLGVFVLLGTLTILTPLGIYYLAGAGAQEILGTLKEWLAAHNAAVMSVLLLVLGAKLIGDAISEF